jgi:hypothetical protein
VAFFTTGQSKHASAKGYNNYLQIKISRNITNLNFDGLLPDVLINNTRTNDLFRHFIL